MHDGERSAIPECSAGRWDGDKQSVQNATVSFDSRAKSDTYPRVRHACAPAADLCHVSAAHA